MCVCLKTTEMENNFKTGCYTIMNIKYGSDLYHLVEAFDVAAIKLLMHSFAIHFNK